MKMFIDEEEWYPVTSLSHVPPDWGDDESIVDIPEEVYNRWVHISEEFNEFQAVLNRYLPK